MPENAFTDTFVSLPRAALLQMMQLVRCLHRFTRNPAYHLLVDSDLPAVARFDPGHAAVMMGYDFHLAEDGPRLIEVNTNAGGGLLACRAAFPEYSGSIDGLPQNLKKKVWQTFCREFSQYRQEPGQLPERIVIIDESPESQFLYVEMCAFAELFREMGAVVEIVDPSQLECSHDGVFLKGARVDLVYNRHCDFYLETDAMVGLRNAYLAGQVCLTPNPRMYGLLADKARLALWSDPDRLAPLQLEPRDQALLSAVVPDAFLLNVEGMESLWPERKQWVFKPTTHYGSKGVLLGEKISRKRFKELPAGETLVQKRMPPSLTDVPEYGSMKTDFRVFAYQQQVLGVTARLYQGQVTNMRTPGGGFAPVKVD